MYALVVLLALVAVRGVRRRLRAARAAGAGRRLRARRTPRCSTRTTGRCFLGAGLAAGSACWLVARASDRRALVRDGLLAAAVVARRSTRRGCRRCSSRPPTPARRGRNAPDLEHLVDAPGATCSASPASTCCCSACGVGAGRRSAARAAPEARAALAARRSPAVDAARSPWLLLAGRRRRGPRATWRSPSAAAAAARRARACARPGGSASPRSRSSRCSGSALTARRRDEEQRPRGRGRRSRRACAPGDLVVSTQPEQVAGRCTTTSTRASTACAGRRSSGPLTDLGRDRLARRRGAPRGDRRRRATSRPLLDDVAPGRARRAGRARLLRTSAAGARRGRRSCAADRTPGRTRMRDDPRFRVVR